MNNNQIMYNLLCLFSPFITFFLLKVLNFRAERVVCEFYTALKENYPHSYVTPNKLVKIIRRLSKMITTEKIHWMHCIGNYLQLVAFILSFVIFSLGLLFSINGIAFIIFDFCMIVLVLWGFFINIFTAFISFRCKKIKKINPKYSKCELRNWD